MHGPLNLNFDLPIFKSSRSSRIDTLLQLENIEEDYLTPSIRKQEKMKVDVLDADLGVEEKKREI